MSWLLEIPLPTPSLNTILTSHWSNRRRMKANWGWAIKAEAVRLNVPKAEKLRRVIVTRLGSKVLDYDNLVGGAKEVLVDNLRDLGLIVDDCPDLVQVTYKQTVGGQRGTLIEIQEVA